MAAAKKGRPSKAELERRKKQQELEERRQRRTAAAGIALFAAGLVLCALAFIEGESVWKLLHDVVFGVFGIFAYCAGPLCLYLAIAVAYGKKQPLPKIIKALLLLLSVAAAVYAFSSSRPGSFVDDFKSLYALGVTGRGGGLLSMLLGWTLAATCGIAATRVVVVILVFVAVMLITGKTIVDLVNGVKKPIDTIKERAQTAAAERELLLEYEQERQQAAAARKIDVPLDAPPSRIDIPLAPSPVIDIAIDNAPAPLPGPNPKRSTVPEALPEKGSAIDIPLGPDFDSEKTGAAADIEPLELKRRASGPAAGVVDELLLADDVISARFADFSGRSQAAMHTGTEPEPVLDDVPVFDAADVPWVEEVDRQEDAADELSAVPPRVASAVDIPLGDESCPETPPYRFPPLSLLERGTAKSDGEAQAELRANADALVATLESFGVRTRVLDVSRGPSVTRYELQPETGVRLSRIVSLADDLALNLAAESVRIEAPIPGKAAVGVEVPNKTASTVNLRTVIESAPFRDADSPLTFALGLDISGAARVGDIARMPHLLIAGSTGMGKSVCINSMIVSLVYKSSPDDLQMILIDPKMVEFTSYSGLPHLYIPVVTDVRRAAGALGSAVGEMLRRYKLFSELSVRNIEEYNALVARRYPEGYEPEEGEEVLEHKPRLVIVIDELADLMMTAPNEVEDSIARIAQMGRASGIHLVVATQRPSVDVITGTIKNNIPSRIAFKVSSQVDSRTILDGAGAEKLIGRGDMLFHAVGQPKPVRIQGSYVSEGEVSAVVDFLKTNAVANYNEAFIREMEENAAKTKVKGSMADADSEDGDPMLEEAIEVVVEAGAASTSLLQRRLKLGYARAARIMDELEERGIVGPPEGSKPRAVNMTRQQWQERMMQTAE